MTAVDLKDVLGGVLSDLQIRLEETHARINVGTFPPIEADASQMRQLMQNLIGNALKFRKNDTDPVITVEARVVEGHDLNCEGPAVVITIADNGIGFDNQYKEQIFTIFQRLHSRNEYEGTGIGLATCRKIVERHGGTIDADGKPGEGATFIVTLPVAQKH